MICPISLIAHPCISRFRQDSGDASRQERTVAFLLYWLPRFVFCHCSVEILYTAITIARHQCITKTMESFLVPFGSSRLGLVYMSQSSYLEILMICGNGKVLKPNPLFLTTIAVCCWVIPFADSWWCLSPFKYFPSVFLYSFHWQVQLLSDQTPGLDFFFVQPDKPFRI